MPVLQVKESPGVLERLQVPFVEVKTTDEGTLSGYGSVFNNVDWYKEKIAPGAFEATLSAHAKAGTMPAMLWQHFTDQVPGVWSTMSEDKRGLKTNGEFIRETQLGKEAHILTMKKAVNGLSIGFMTKRSERDEESGIRTLLEIDLWEVSIVTFPANPKARITGVKSIPTGIREFEEFLRDAGFSARAAVKIAARGFKAADDARDEPDALAELSNIIKRNTNLIQRKS